MRRLLRILLRCPTACERCGDPTKCGHKLCALCGAAIEFDFEVARQQQELQPGDEIVVRILVP